MARPIGVKQARNESKYWLPDGIKLKEEQTNSYNKDTKLVFIDEKYGEFISYFRAIQQANGSTHEKAIVERRNKTMLEKYGVENVSLIPEKRRKAEQTMKERYGVEHALKSEVFLEKSRQTSLEHYGTEYPMQSLVVREHLKDSMMEKYGVENSIFIEGVHDKMKQTNLERYGFENASKSQGVIEKILESQNNNLTNKTSKPEEEMRSFCNSLGFEALSGYIGGAEPKQIDIKIPEAKVMIEHNGLLWHSIGSKGITPKYHLRKTELAMESGYKLIHIFEHEWKNKKDQVKSFLRSTLGKNEIKINARDTEFVELTKEETNKFLERYHILGKCPHTVSYGLKKDNELLCLITLGQHHRGKKELILSRYVGKENVTVRGGLSKLCKNAFRIHGEFSTWIDRRFSNGESWINSGWNKLSVLRPDYFYYDPKKHKVLSKQSRRKNVVNTPKHMTESEHAKVDGLKRVYDSGKIKLVYKG